MAIYESMRQEMRIDAKKIKIPLQNQWMQPSFIFMRNIISHFEMMFMCSIFYESNKTRNPFNNTRKREWR